MKDVIGSTDWWSAGGKCYAMMFRCFWVSAYEFTLQEILHPRLPMTESWSAVYNFLKFINGLCVSITTRSWCPINFRELQEFVKYATGSSMGNQRAWLWLLVHGLRSSLCLLLPQSTLTTEYEAFASGLRLLMDSSHSVYYYTFTCHNSHNSVYHLHYTSTFSS